MWFKLAKADWSGDGNNLGTMDSLMNAWSVTYSISGGLTKLNAPSYVTKGSTLTATFTLADGATISGTPSCTSGTISTPTVSGTTVTITVTGISDNCTVTIAATGGSSSGGDSGSGTNLFTIMDTTYTDKTQNGITFTWNDDVCAVSGTATSQAFNNMIQMEPLVDPLIPGNTYRFELDSTDSNVFVKVFQTVDGTSKSTNIKENGTFTYDAAATRTVIRLQVDSGSTVDGTISVRMYST